MTSDASKLCTTILNAVYFSLAMAAFIFLFVTYAGPTLISVPITLLSLTYALALICAVYCLVRRDFLVGTSVYVLSRTTQRIIRISALLLPVPALVFTAMFFNCLSSYDGSAAAIQRVVMINHIEVALFGKSAILGLMTNGTQTATQNQTQASSADDQIDYLPYITRMQTNIKAHWLVTQKKEPESIVVQIKVLRDGTLARASVVRSSGSAEADAAAIDAIKACAPLEPLPAGSPDNIDIQYAFALTPDSSQQYEDAGLTDQY